MIPLNYDNSVQKHLRPDEQLLWVGRSRRGWFYRWNNPFIVLQAVWLLLTCWYAIELVSIVAGWAGVDLGLPRGLPGPQIRFFIALGWGLLTLQSISNYRRRAATWYAVTSRRVYFVLTTKAPQSVISIDFDEIARVSLNRGFDVPAPFSAIIIKLKQIDPYLANSNVLGYQMWAKQIVLEDVENPREFYELIHWHGRVPEGLPRPERS